MAAGKSWLKLVAFELFTPWLCVCGEFFIILHFTLYYILPCVLLYVSYDLYDYLI